MENENAGSRSDTQDIQERGSVAPLIGSIDCCGGEPDRDFQSRGIDEFLLLLRVFFFFFFEDQRMQSGMGSSKGRCPVSCSPFLRVGCDG